MKIIQRNRILVNTDPRRRCYDGCHAKSELVWTEWETLESGLSKESADRKMNFWTELNDYAVSQRGEEARREFKLVEEDEV